MEASSVARCGRHMLVALCWLCVDLTRSEADSRCVDRACSPPIGNLATGRRLLTLSGCCGNISQSLCPFSSDCPSSHSTHLMTDDSFTHPHTWWSSKSSTGQDEIRLDLEAQFCLSHVLLLFRSPRPAAMAIERSSDFGKTWEVLKLFAHNCSMEFGLSDDYSQTGSLCTSKYSSDTPCSGGEVILRLLYPSAKQPDPYSPEAVARLSLTNLRIRLMKAQSCSANTTHSTSATQSPDSAAPFAVYSLQARGTCLCHGHAEQCEAYNGSRGTHLDSNMVLSKCVCSHHTAGHHCEKCAPLYNDQPWRPANGSSGVSNPCQKCECHGHSDRCHFSPRAWLASNGTSGGVCDNCQHNTAGRRCQRCRYGFYRRPALPPSSPYACIRCRCDPMGSLPTHPGEDGPWCHPRSGQCLCKAGVRGISCTRCRSGYWGFGDEGCRLCSCPYDCNPVTGDCHSSYNNQMFQIPIGGKISDLVHSYTEEVETWSKALAVSALHYTGKCNCKEKKLRSVNDFCMIRHDYVIKASVLSAHDKGSYAEVQVKIRKVLRSPQAALDLGPTSIYPLSWTRRGCTCPILNPGQEYLLAGPEEAATGRLLVTMQSVVMPWTTRLGLLISEGLRNGCP